MELDNYGKNGVREDTSELDQDVAAKRYNDMMDRVDMDRMGKKQVREVMTVFRLDSMLIRGEL